MDEKTIDGEVVLNDNGVWGFQTDDNESYSSEVPTAIDSILGINSQHGERFRITVEKI